MTEVIVKKGEKHQGVSFPEGTKLLVQADGTVRLATLSRDFTLSGYRLLAGSELQIYENGALFELSPVAGQKIGDLTFAAGEAQALRFSKDGKLESLFLPKGRAIHGVQFGAGGQAYFHANAKLARGMRLAAQQIDGLNIAEGSEALFHADGKLKQATLGKESRYGRWHLMPDPNPASPAHVEIYENRQLKAALLARNGEIQGLVCGPGRISFFESGKLESCTLGADASVQLNSYPKEAKAGDRLTLAEDGRVVGWGGR